MSYDIFAFDLLRAPTGDGSMLEWFKEQATWSEPHSYDDVSVTTPSLQAFYRELVSIYPPLNGPDASDFSDDVEYGDYAIGYSLVYVGYGWSLASEARNAFLRLGAKHQVGVCEISENPPQVHRPTNAD